MKWSSILAALIGVTWTGLWFTPDQQGQRLMQRGDFQAAAEAFEDPMWQGVALFSDGEFEAAERAFARVATPEADYNRGNCLVMLGKYEAAVTCYEQALTVRPGWKDARINRDIAAARAKRVERRGGEMGDQKVGADEITFEKGPQSNGQETTVESDQSLSQAEMQALWLRRVQTKPAEFLKAKFAYQLATHGGDEENR
jgi:Ca-activated chloride channel homolog